MIDIDAFRSISYGLYLVSSRAEEESAGCTVNTFAQVTSDPLQVSVAVNKENHTASIIERSGAYTAVSLAQSASMELIGKFGFFCSRDVDKFEPFSVRTDGFGCPYVAEQAVARFSVKVTDSVDLGTHTLFIGVVVEAEILSDEEPMTYAYYHAVKGGKTPPKASSFIADRVGDAAAGRVDANDGSGSTASQGDGAGSFSAVDASTAKREGVRYGWRCTVCGHVEEVDELPDDFTCPICGVGKEMFERIEL